MRATIRVLVMGLLSACLLGCATPGRVYDDSKVAMIKKDVTSEAELLDWFGPASTRAVSPDGTKMLTWRFLPAEGHGKKSSGRLDVRLGTDGKVTAYTASAGS